ncbi:MAG: NMD3-related protein [Candidatus Woesearchaeota archaeon]|nr:NMD3-related protein [Candidatus Woesearchaeota archaeon]
MEEQGDLCISCGKKAEIERLCRQCYLKNNPIVAGFKDISMEKCASCGKILISDKAAFPDLDSFISNFLVKHVKAGDGFSDLRFEHGIVLPEHSGAEGTKVLGTLNVKVRASARENQKIRFSEDYSFPMEIRFKRCKICAKQKSQYFEGIIQLRKGKSDESKRIFEEISEYIKGEILAQNEKGVFITKEDDTSNGTDFYITSNSSSINLARQIAARFGCELKINERLFSKDRNGKDLFRVSSFLRVPEYAPGSIIALTEESGKETLVRVLEFSKGVVAEDLKTGKKISFKPKDCRIQVLTKGNAEIIQERPNILLLHPETFQAVVPENLKNPFVSSKYKGKNSAKVVVYNDIVYLV